MFKQVLLLLIQIITLQDVDIQRADISRGNVVTNNITTYCYDNEVIVAKNHLTNKTTRLPNDVHRISWNPENATFRFVDDGNVLRGDVIHLEDVSFVNVTQFLSSVITQFDLTQHDEIIYIELNDTIVGTLNCKNVFRNGLFYYRDSTLQIDWFPAHLFLKLLALRCNTSTMDGVGKLPTKESLNSSFYLYYVKCFYGDVTLVEHESGIVEYSKQKKMDNDLNIFLKEFNENKGLLMMLLKKLMLSENVEHSDISEIVIVMLVGGFILYIIISGFIMLRMYKFRKNKTIII